jgi:tetratricopeptide (TPR) repeat protein
MNLINYLSNYLNERVDNFVESQDYHYLETSLKSSNTIKQQYKEELNQFKSTVLIDQFIQTLEYMSKHLPEICNDKEIKQIKKEFEEANQTFVQNLNKAMEFNEIDENLKFQEMYGFSNQTLQCIYRLGNHCFTHHQLIEAKQIFNLLVYLAPHVSSFWIALGICYYQEKKITEALAFLDIAEHINPKNPLIYIYKCECLLIEDQHSQVQNELKKIEDLFEDSSLKDQWVAQYESLKNKMNRK